MTTEDYSLEALEARRTDLKRQLTEKENLIQRRINFLFEPEPANNLMQQSINNVGRVIAVVDGAMTGYKLLKRLRTLLRNKK